ncbi:MAG: glycosyltransferase family 87 protein [Beijerinckiaceae bacterium]|nr:glycosyltransferase family 87 protein [Beijerinckiaceae bacterium]
MTGAVARGAGRFFLCLFFVWVIAGEAARVQPGDLLWDFGSFVASAQAGRQGLNPYGIYPLTFYISLPGFEAWNPNLNPPVSVLLFQLFGSENPHAAFIVWRWVSVAIYVAIVSLLLWRYPVERPLPLILCLFALAGFWDTLLLGQIYLPLVLATVAAWLLLERREDLWAGLLIGFVVCLKPNFLVWPALLFLSGSFRVALIASATAAAISLVPLLVYGPGVYMQWIELVLSDKERPFFLTNASLMGLAARAGLSTAGAAMGALVLASLAAWALLRRPPPLQVSAIALVAAVLASPLGWIHYTLFLLPIIVARWDAIAMRLVAITFATPVPFVIDQMSQPMLTRLTIGSVYAWGLLLCFGLLLWEVWRENTASRAFTSPAVAR